MKARSKRSKDTQVVDMVSKLCPYVDENTHQSPNNAASVEGKVTLPEVFVVGREEDCAVVGLLHAKHGLQLLELSPQPLKNANNCLIKNKSFSCFKLKKLSSSSKSTQVFRLRCRGILCTLSLNHKDSSQSMTTLRKDKQYLLLLENN